MIDLAKELDHLTTQIETYKGVEVTDGETLSGLLQQITATLYTLERERSTYHDQFQGIVHKLVLKGIAVNKAENEAHVHVPEMYMLRRIMDAAYEVVGAIRTQISWLKTERQSF